MGMSTAGMDSLVAASLFQDITLTFGLTPSDFVWQGFEHGTRFVLRFIFKAAKEYPNECEETRKDIDRKLSAALKEWWEA